MKLKQKAFIIIFAVTLALTTAAGVLLLRLFYDGDNSERDLLHAERLNILASEFDSYITEFRNNRRWLVLSNDDIASAAKEFFEDRSDSALLTFPDKSYVGNIFYEVSPPDDGLIAFQEVENGAAVIVSRRIHLETGDHILSLYIKKEGYRVLDFALLLFAGAAVISFTAASTGAVFALSIEKKLQKIHIEASEMINDRTARISECGQSELDRITSVVNSSADALADDMEKLKIIADGRKQFVDNLAHEMKTPLTSILGFADILRIRRSVDDRARMEYANIIFEEARRMRGLSGKLLELATAGSANLDFDSVEIPSLFDEIRLSVLPLIAQRKMTLKAYPQNARIIIDRELFKSLIYNLIENAAKASAEGSEIRLICEKSADTVKISVSDDGCGMTREQIKRAAEPFYMVDKSRSRKAGGAGLGLALCAEIAQRHRARLTISSKQGKGTTVTLTMPSALSSSNGGQKNED